MLRPSVTRAFSTALILTIGLVAGNPAAAQIACTEAALRAAIDGVNDGDTITIPDLRTITLSGAADDDGNVSGDLDLAGNITSGATDFTIEGSGPGRTIIDGGGVDRVFHIGAGKNVTIRNLTIRGGDATQNIDVPLDEGGGIRNSDGALTLENIVITLNKGRSGGGIFDSGGAMTLTKVAIVNNVATAGSGGGLTNGSIGDSLTNVTISRNTAAEVGGGIHNGGPMTLIHVTVANNTADSDNAGTGDGGGIYTEPGGGGSTTIAYTLIGGNTIGSSGTGPDCNAVSSADYNVIQDTTGCTVTAGPNDQFDVDPKIAALANNGGFTLTHGLLATSPAINAGITCPPDDQRGVARDASCDIGAFELNQASLEPNLAVAVNQEGYLPGDPLSLGSTVFNNFGSPISVDLYAGFAAPPSVDLLGCGAINLVFVTGSGSLFATCLNAPPSTWPKLAAGAVIPDMTGSDPTVQTLFSTSSVPTLPAGIWRGFVLLTPVGGLADDDPGEGFVLVTVDFAIPAP
jgi:hypothetical protein